MISDIRKYIVIGREIIQFSKENFAKEDILEIRYKIINEDKEIRLYNVPRILTFEEKSVIYYAILDCYYFNHIINSNYRKDEIADYVVKENGYTYHTFNQIEGDDFGILGELLFEIPRQKIETEKLSEIRDIYEMLQRNKNIIGKEPILIAFNGIMPDFYDITNVVRYIVEKDPEISKNKDNVNIVIKKGFLGKNKQILILPKVEK